MPQDSYTLANIVSAIALYLQTTWIVAIRNLTNNLQFRSKVVKLSLNISKAIDTADDLCSIFSQTIQDYAKRFLAHLVSHFSNLDCTLSSSKALVTSQESEALSLLTQQTSSQVTMTNTYLTVVSHRTRDAEALQTNTDSLGSISSSLYTFLDSDSSTTNICPLGILKADTLCFLAHQIWVNTSLFTNLVGLFNTVDAILLQSCKNLVDTAFLTLKLYFSNHRRSSLFFTWINSLYCTLLFGCTTV